MRTPRVVGLDLSITSTGVAMSTPNGQVGTATIRPRKRHGLGIERMDFICDQIHRWVDGADLVVIEGPSYGSSGAGSHERAGLWWRVVRALQRAGIPTAIAPPKNRAQYAYGDGTGNKREVVAGISALCPWWDASKRPGLEDEADALALCAMGCDHLGSPVCEAPERHRRALAGVQWPAMARDEGEPDPAVAAAIDELTRHHLRSHVRPKIAQMATEIVAEIRARYEQRGYAYLRQLVDGGAGESGRKGICAALLYERRLPVPGDVVDDVVLEAAIALSRQIDN